MYQNCCKKCGSISLHTEVKGNNTGLYCDDCGAWLKWLGKDELRAFEYSKNKEKNNTPGLIFYADDLKKIFKMLERLSFKVDLGYTETYVVKLVDIEDALINAFKQ